MILLSHGQGSDLLEHLQEVMTCAGTMEERIALACHDIGKATAAWQAYIRQESRTDSPHPHAAAGGILAAYLLLRLGKAESVLKALHVNAAHHGYLSKIDSDDLKSLEMIALDSQAKEFFLDRNAGIASLLPKVPQEVMTAAWEDFRKFTICSFQENPAWRTPEPDLLTEYLKSRDFLGRLCFTDQASARKQSQKDERVLSWTEAYSSAAFRKRHERNFASTAPITILRSKLRHSFLQILEKDAPFHFIDAPTGLGKTEAMLQGAELILKRQGYDKIVYAVPQVSIADQIYEEYFNDTDHAGIWNYLRKDSKSKEEQNPAQDAKAMEIEAHPFACSYNVTTFNQVLLAMCHPNRLRCIRSLGLRNAVIIFDEFHKLPMPILPLFFRLARIYADLYRCRFIFGSATPLENLDYWKLNDLNRVPLEESMPVYKDPLIDNRRQYQFTGIITLEDLKRKIQDFHDFSPDKNLLVVVNLVGKASWPLRQYFCGGYFPWKELDDFSQPSEERKIVVLDGLVPPCLRRQIVTACKKIMRSSPGKLTLISTQMIEVGVDLDFDAAMIDYQGLASVIQRGGRVGREGRNEPCPVEVFSLRVSEKTTFEILWELPSELKKTVLEEAAALETNFREKEREFFLRKTGPAFMKDSDLSEALASLQKRIFDTPAAIQSSKRLAERIFQISQVDAARFGAGFENAQYIAEMYSAEAGEPVLVLRNTSEADSLFALEEKIRKNESEKQERETFFHQIAQHRISVGDKKILEALKLPEYRELCIPEPLKVYVADSENVW